MARNKPSAPVIQDGSPAAQKRRKKDQQRATGTAKALKITQPERVKRYLDIIKTPKPTINILDKNCLTCRRYAKCDNKKKRFNYLCDRYKPLNAVPTAKKPENKPKETVFIVQKKNLLKPRRDPTESELTDLRFRKIIDQALEEFQTTQLPPDILIDDRDLPLAKNIVDFCSKEFLNTTLFAKQVETGLHLNAEFCPNKKCTDLKYVFDIPLHDTISDILERVQLLNWGKCPRCKQTRSDFYNENKMKVPFELGGLAGQRCVTGDTLLSTAKGFISFKNLAKHHINVEGFTNYNGPEIVLENGAVVAPDKFYRGKKENIYKLTTFNGFEIKGRNEHPIKTHRGWVQLQHIKETDCIPIYINQQIWSCTKLSLEAIARKAKALSKIYLKTVHINKNRVKCEYLNKGTLDEDLARLIGFYIAEGSTRRISNIDKNVLNFCYSQFIRLYGINHVSRYWNEISLRFKSSQIHWNLLVEDMQRRSAKKQIPQHIMCAPKHIVCAFLQALFEGDGSASEDMVSYTSISKMLIKQLSVLLSNLGIPHRVQPFMTWATNGTINQVSKKAWQIDIEGEFACTRFRDQINFFSDRKKKQLNEVINKNTIDMPCFYGKFPNEVKKEFLEILDAINKDLAQYRNWSRSKHSFQKKQTHSIRGMFDINSDFTRIYADNVALSKRRLKNYYVTITNHYFYGMIRENTKSVLDKFYHKYSGDDVYWVSVKNVKILKKQQFVYDIRVPTFHRFMANGILNHNSGKSAGSKIQLAYGYHRWIKQPNAAAVFGLLPEEILNSYLVGLTFAKAKTLLFDGVHNYLKKAPWFAKYNEFLDDAGKRVGEELYNIKDHYINYRHRNLMIQPQGPDMRKMRGITAFMSAIDEIGWFINSASARNITGDGGNAIKINGAEVYASVSNAFTTLRSSYRRLLEAGKPNLPVPFLLNTSSPSSKKDMIVQLYKESRNSPDIYGYHYATWEYNPQITRKDLQGKFNSNYAKALRDFGAVPPNSSLPFIEKMKQVKPLCSSLVANNLSYRPSFTTLQSGVNKLTGRVIFRKNETNIPHIMCFDAGHTNNSFAIVTGYYDSKKEMPVFDGFLEVIPSSDTPISFTAMFDDIMTPIIEKMNVKFVASDRWQNLKFFSDIENAFEIETGAFPLKYDKFLQFKEDVDGVGFLMPMPEVKFKDIDALTSNDYPNSFLYKPVAHMVSQMLTVQDVGKDVIKGPELTDDLFRATVLAHSYLNDPDYQDLFSAIGDDVIVKRALGSVGLSNQGGGSAGRSVNGIGTSASRGR